jgi:hypothetical protein
METMVDNENTFWLAALSNSVALPLAAEETTRMSNQHKPNFSSEAKLQWAGSRDRNLGPPVKAELFS